MCGIAGILTGRADLNLGAISQAMLESLRHRGPDDEGQAEIPLPNGLRLSLVHTRLSILDLSAAGHQPMGDPSSGSWITYNGEIYNHQAIRATLRGADFRSNCDTETILKAWDARGSDTIASLRGMFALALYDGRRNELYLLRDRLGIKPLYIYQADKSTWVFASELRALLASGLVPRRLNPIAIDSFLAFGAVPAPWTLIEGVRSLHAGEYWRFDLAETQQPLIPHRVRYWSPSFAPRGAQLRYAEAVERLRPLFLEALSSHMLSDVPVGVFLSGGIDSSSVVGALAHSGHSLHTFSVLFEQRDYDESRQAALVARKYGATHTALAVSAADIIDHFETALSAYDHPSIDGVNTYFISRAVYEAGIRVALSGLGGDELFAGYATFQLAAYADNPVYRRLTPTLYQLWRRSRPGTARTEKLGALANSGSSRLEHYSIFRQVMMPDRRSELLEREYFGTPTCLPEETVERLQDASRRLDVVNSYSLFELSLYMTDMLLRDTDQMSMAHPVEVRTPYVDHVLVEAIASLPGNLKLPGFGQRAMKRLLVDLLPEPIPDSVTRRPKMGFVFPWELWLRKELNGAVSEILSDATTIRAAGLHPSKVEKLWNDFRDHRPGIRYTDILSLTHLIFWTRQHRMAA